MKKRVQLWASVLTACLIVSNCEAETLTYYPSMVGIADGDAYMWDDVSGWYKTRSTYRPNAAFGALPGYTDTVFVVQSALSEVPLVIKGGDICVSNLYLAGNDNANVWKETDDVQGKGVKLKMTGGSLSVENFYMSNMSSSPMWGVFDLAGGTVNVANTALLGTAGAKPEQWSSIIIGNSAKMNFAEELHIASRIGQNGFAVTNNGALTVGELYVGAEGRVSNAQGTGVVHNAGILNVAGSINLCKECETVSAGYLYLKRGSQFTFGSKPGSVFTIAGRKGMGVLDTEIPIDVGHVTFSFGDGETGSEAYLKLRDKATISGLPNGALTFAKAQSGSAYLEMYDDSFISSVSTFECGYPKKSNSGIMMRGNAVITNVHVICSALSTGTRTGGTFNVDLDDNAKIVYTNSTTKGNTFKAYDRTEARADLRFAGKSVVENLDSLTFTSAGLEDLGGTLRLEGGTIKFRTDYTHARLSLGESSEHVNASMIFSGYGIVTRTDFATLANSNHMKLFCNFPKYCIEADGMGEKRDLDLRAFREINDGVECNVGGVERKWQAKNKGRLLYPRASKTLCGYTLLNPERTVGNYSLQGTNEYGVAIAPTVPGTFNVSFRLYGNTTGDKAYLYAAQYAADRDDYPHAGTSMWQSSQILNIYRLGVADDWRDDDPKSPFDNFVEMSVNFCYDTNRVDGTKPVNVYYSTGRGRKKWVKVGTATASKAGVVRTSAIKPIVGESWNLGYFAVVEGELGPDPSRKFIIVVR